MTNEDLKKWREDRAVSQQALADALHVAVMTVSRWERGERGIPPYLYLALESVERRLPKKPGKKKGGVK